MKKTPFIFFVALLFTLLLTACGPSFGDHMSVVQTIEANTSVARAPRVDIGSSDVHTNSRNTTFRNVIAGVNMASDIAGAAISMEQEKRIQTIISNEDLAANLAVAFVNQYAGLNPQYIINDSPSVDARINVIVHNYGIYADSLSSPFRFYMDGQIDVVMLNPNKRIYSKRYGINRSLNDLEYYGDIVSTAISAALNLTTFFTLEDEQIIQIFLYMAQEMGNELALKLYNDAHR